LELPSRVVLKRKFSALAAQWFVFFLLSAGQRFVIEITATSTAFEFTVNEK
jgi:hypothetical protein